MKIERNEQWFSNPPYVSTELPVYRLTPETEEEVKILGKMATELHHTDKALELRFFVYSDGKRDNPKSSEAPKSLDFIVISKD